MKIFLKCSDQKNRESLINPNEIEIDGQSLLEIKNTLAKLNQIISMQGKTIEKQEELLQNLKSKVEEVTTFLSEN